MEASSNGLRITERSNPVTQNIDTSAPQDIINQISQCEQEIFQGWKEYENIFSERILQSLEQVVDRATEIITNPEKSCIVMSGCGTSGRLAFFVSRNINKFLQRELGQIPCCDYLIAGGDVALLKSTEAQEDDPILGSAILDQLCAGKDKVLYIGITCGLSAAYIAGQIDYCLHHLDKVFPVLIGFNPLNQARDHPIEKWDQTCASVFNKLNEAQSVGKAAILNPVIGPEPITGSSRMKGGTATKVLLDIIIQVSLYRVISSKTEGAVHSVQGIIKVLLELYFKVMQSTPREWQLELADVITAAGKSLNNDGHIYYLGKDQLGMLGLIDASECPPTFGSDFQDVRGFIQGGFSVWGNHEGDLGLGSKHDIDIQSFKKNILPQLSDRDSIILICSSKDQGNDIDSLCEDIQKTSAVMVCVEDERTFQKSAVIDGSNLELYLRLPWTQFEEPLGIFPPQLQRQIRENLLQLCVKRTLNMISTAAHVLKGKVYQNYMIDLKLSNNKLFHRGISIMVKLLGVTEDLATVAILRAIYSTDHLTEGQRDGPISQHIASASRTPKVLPVTILLLSIENCTIEEALQTLSKYPAIRTAFHTLSKV